MVLKASADVKNVSKEHIGAQDEEIRSNAFPFG